MLGLEGGVGRQAPLGSVLCGSGGVGGEWRTEHFPLILPDSPLSLGGGGVSEWRRGRACRGPGAQLFL